MCLDNIGPLHDNILSVLAKSDFVPKDDLKLIEQFKTEVKQLAERADNHVDAAKALKKKIGSLLESL